MGPSIHRRDFLKLLSLLPAAFYAGRRRTAAPQSETDLNILILIFDSWTYENSSLYGYPRQTTPNIKKWADRAAVYHNHWAAGHYTYPSTASLLSGVLPWTHKGYWPGPEMFLPRFETDNIFTLFDTHFLSAYSNNSLAESVIARMGAGTLDLFPPREHLALQQPNFWEPLFKRDRDIYDVSWVRSMDLSEDGFANSLFAARLLGIAQNRLQRRYADLYPRGLPVMVGNFNFLLEESIDWIAAQTAAQPEPFLNYFHLLPPHEPYTTRADYIDLFKDDGYEPIYKPTHPLADQERSREDELALRRGFDEYLAFVDAEFDRLMGMLEQSGQLDNTIVILTSDHGEMFERGIYFHMVPSFHKPLIHIPLLIFTPGQTGRIDIHDLTSTVDVLPTLLHLTGKPVPAWMEGQLLPPYNPSPDPERMVFSADLRHNPKDGPIINGTGMLRYKDWKLTHIFGSEAKYEPLSGELYELYNLAEDPEELTNLHGQAPDIETDLIASLTDKIRQAE